MAERFAVGDLAILIDHRERRYLVKLGTGRVFSTHVGALPHDQVIGQEEGCRLLTHSGHRMLALRPTLADYILKMPRSSQVIYPKDIGAILVHADIYPGAVVLEAGIGSGALTLALLRAVGPTGRVVSYDVREDLAAQALRNIHGWMPGVENFALLIQDVYEGVQEREVDRLVLDLPEPWRAVPVAAGALRPGGILLSFLPTVLQIHHLYQALTADPHFDLIESFEVLHRPWHLGATSARPAHRMVAHTGFITKAVRCAPRPATPAAGLSGNAKEEEADADQTAGPLRHRGAGPQEGRGVLHPGPGA